AASRLTFVELCSAMARSWRKGELNAQQRDRLFDRIPLDFGELAFVIEPTRAVYARAVELIRAHQLRAYDAIQLASCLELKARGKATELWGEDGDLLAAA